MKLKIAYRYEPSLENSYIAETHDFNGKWEYATSSASFAEAKQRLLDNCARIQLKPVPQIPPAEEVEL